MDLSKISNQKLVGRLEKLVASERKITNLVLSHIVEVEARRLYADLGFDSMYAYLTKKLGYSEDSAYRRLSAARLLKQAPEISEKLENGSVTLTQLAQVQKCIKQEKKIGGDVDAGRTLQILEQIQNKSSFETQKVLAVEFNQSVQIHEKLKPQQDESVRLELTLTKEQMESLQQVKEILSHVLPDPSWTEVIEYLAKTKISKTQGKSKNTISAASEGVSQVTNAKEASVYVGPKDMNTTRSFLVARKRKPLKVTLKRRLLRKAGSCCEFVVKSTGQRCGSRYQLQIDHIVPFALGGSDSAENMRVLCRTHNLQIAKSWGLNRN